jgi:hypothetical protein
MKREDWKFLAGAWLPAVGVITYGLAGKIGYDLCLRFVYPFEHPAVEPPWYFIRQDYVQGLVMAILGLLCLVLGLLLMLAKRHPVWSGMLAWQSVLSFGIPAWQAFVVALRCDNVLDRATATTEWQTFDAYLTEPLRAHGFVLGSLLSLVILGASMFFERQRRLEAQGTLTPVGEPLA